MNLNKLFHISRAISEDKKYLNKYSYFALEFKVPHYRLLSIGDIISNKITKQDLPEYFINFVGEQGEVLLMFNIVNKQVLLCMARSLHGDKMFSAVGSQTKFFYGQGMLNKNFKYGDPIILVEGNMDRDCMSLFYPNILSVMSSSLTKSQMQILEFLTNNIILAYDNDVAGIKGSKRDYFRLKDKNFNVKILNHYKGFKDVGDLFENKYVGEEYTYSLGCKYYSTQIKNLVNSLGGIV